MKILTRTEELILLAVWRLKDRAYSVSIHEEISKLSGKVWSLGSIYMPLERLVKRRLLQTYLSEYTPERGGRHKRIYELTKDGMHALDKIREIQDKVWDGVPRFNVRESK